MSIRLEARNRGNIRLDMDNASLAAKYAREAGAAEKAAELSAANAAGAAERADAAAEAALRAEAGAQSAAVHLPQPGENGTWLVWDQAGDSYVDSGENCTGVQGERGLKGDTGDKGDTGSKGDDGVSPTVTVTDITGGHRVTITDANHPQGQPFDVMDGEVAQEDFDELSGDVDDLKCAIDNNVLRALPSKNLYNPALNESGRMYFVNPGSKQTTTTSPTQVFQKMEVAVGEAYALSGVSRASLTDENDIVVENLTATDTNCIIQSVPAGVKYLWIETNATIASTVTQVEYGTVITAYEPFGHSSSVGYGDTKVFDLDFPFDELGNVPSDIDNLYNDVTDLKTATEVEGLFTDVSGFNGITTYSGYVNSNGDFVSATTGWIRTDYIATGENAPIIASLKGYSTNPIIAFYNSEKEYLGNISIISNSELIVNVNDYVPSGVAYAVIVSQTSYAGRSFTIGTPANLAESIEVMASDIYPYKGVKVLCMGDSLTAGRDGIGNILLHNYPYFMKETRLKGCVIDNKGVVGSTTVTYWANNMSALNLDNTIDVVLMMWGTNGQLVKNTLATDVEPYDDYNDYADTGCGDFCKIIEYVMEHTQNSAQIILLTPPYNGSSAINDRVILAQPVVKAIAERYNLPVIDMFKCGIGAFNFATYMPDDSVHFSENGYKWIGAYIGSQVDSVCAKLK